MVLKSPIQLVVSGPTIKVLKMPFTGFMKEESSFLY